MPGGGAKRWFSATLLKSASMTSSLLVSVCGLMSKPLRSLGCAALVAGGGAAGLFVSAHAADSVAASATAAMTAKLRLPLLGFITPELSHTKGRGHLSECGSIAL